MNAACCILQLRHCAAPSPVDAVLWRLQEVPGGISSRGTASAAQRSTTARSPALFLCSMPVGTADSVVLWSTLISPGEAFTAALER